ncbi:MAG: glycosyl hydrolase [Bacteroidota bacterium]|nr:glycosyl hydrolase [Candidatus Kapabacteria bacterium]MDW8219878.1 glycosyl hydrolase [Bacteroidota bacterium]
MHHPLQTFLGTTLCCIMLIGYTVPTYAQLTPPRDTTRFKNLKFRNIGPALGGRISRVCGVPGNPLVYYAATASGGVWKSIDGGTTWQPIMDDQPVASIGSIAVAPSDPNIIYVGSGEANPRGNVAAGNGIFKSTDGGKTWKHVWKAIGQIGTMIVHPTNPDIAFAAVLGNPFAPSKERGVYRTKDGGKTWERVLFKNEDTGASDVCFDLTNPTILFAGLWQMRRKPWEMQSGGPGSGLYTSRDGGDTWQQLTHRKPDGSPSGLPEGIMGKIGVGVAPSDGNRVYALIEHENGGLFRSDDGGTHWRLVNGARSLRQRAWYYSTLTINPMNPDDVWFPQVPMLRTLDGGHTLQRVNGFRHGDHHDLWIDPKNPNRMINGNDGGVEISTDGGKTWIPTYMPTMQFYHVAVDNSIPYTISGAAQDWGTFCAAHNSLDAGGIDVTDWYSVGGGEAGYTQHHPLEPHIVYAGEYGGTITRYDHRTRTVQNITVYPTNTSGRPASDLRYRFQWTAPILISPHDPNTVYHAANVLFKTTDAGKTWTAISSDLTRNDKSKQQWSGGPITGDNTGVETYCTIFALAESPAKAGVLWVGTDDGLVHVSQDGGKTWTNVTKNIPGLPEFATITTIEPSSTEAGTAYVVAEAHRLGDFKPYLWKTTDFGKSWKGLATKLPQDQYLHVVREDPKKRGMLYVGTELGLYMSPDDGISWQPLIMNFPPVAVHDMVIKNNDLVIATHGRSFWVFDDLTPLRELASGVPSSDIALLPIQQAYRWHISASRSGGPGAMPNPPQGVILHYWLKNTARSVTLDILDAQGTLIRSYSNKPEPEPTPPAGEPSGGRRRRTSDTLSLLAGLHRFVWNMRHTGAEFIRDAQTDGGDIRSGPLAAPGTYTARLTVDGASFSQPIQLVADPRQAINSQQFVQTQAFCLAVRDTISAVTRLVQQIRTIRKQLTERSELLKSSRDSASYTALIKSAQLLIQSCDSIEGKLHNATAKVPYDILAGKNNTGAKLYSILSALYDATQSDEPITQGMREVFAEEVQKLGMIRREWNNILTRDLDAWNKQARTLDIPHIFVPVPR